MTQLHDEHVLRCVSPAAGPFDAALRRDLSSRMLDLLEVLPLSQREVIRLNFKTASPIRRSAGSAGTAFRTSAI